MSIPNAEAPTRQDSPSQSHELLGELLALPPRRRRQALKEERFHDPILAELLIDESEAAQLERPREAAELAELALALNGRLEEAALEGPGDYFLARAWCLRGDAFRLAGDLVRAERSYQHALPLLDRPDDASELCRGLGLLRWEQGRTAEARALLGHAASLFAKFQLQEEEGACLALLGLLSLEEGDPVQGLLELRRAQPLLDESKWPWLGARTALALGLCLAEAGHLRQALEWRAEAPHLAKGVAGEEERLRLRALEARLLARTGDLEEGLTMLREVRAGFLERDLLPEAALATLELARLLVEAGRAEELTLLRTETAAGLPERELLLTAPALDELAAGNVKDLREVVCRHAYTLRRLLRLQGVRVEPLPFA